MTTTETSIEIRHIAQELLGDVERTTLEVIKGSHNAGVELIYTFVPIGQDEGPKIPLEPEILNKFSPRERWALTYTHDSLSKFNREFGWYSSEGHRLTPSNHLLVNFLINLSRATQGILHPEKEYGDHVVENQILVNESYEALIQWAS